MRNTPKRNGEICPERDWERERERNIERETETGRKNLQSKQLPVTGSIDCDAGQANATSKACLTTPKNGNWKLWLLLAGICVHRNGMNEIDGCQPVAKVVSWLKSNNNSRLGVIPLRSRSIAATRRHRSVSYLQMTRSKWLDQRLLRLGSQVVRLLGPQDRGLFRGRKPFGTDWVGRRSVWVGLEWIGYWYEG